MRPVDSTEHYDKLLVSRFVGGDESAFDDIVAAHKDALARLVHRVLGWPEDTEDVVQDVFLLAFKNLRKFDGRSSLRTWLAAIAVNRCRRHLRKGLLRRRLFSGAKAEQGYVSDDPAAMAENRAMQRETLQQVRLAVQRLPGRYREVAVLHYLEEMSIEQTAEVLGLTRNLVRVRLHRARAKLKKTLAGLMEN